MMVKKVNRHTRAGRNGKVVQCPKCGSLSTLYGFSFSAITCGDCNEWIEKYDLIIPDLSREDTLKAIHRSEIDNAVRNVCAVMLKDYWQSDPSQYAKKFRYFYGRLRVEVLNMRLEEAGLVEKNPDDMKVIAEWCEPVEEEIH